MAVIFLSLLSSSNTQWYTAWAIVSAVSSVYAYIWDIVMDWGLRPWALPGHLSKAKRPFLYPSWCYYAAGCTNGVARLTWALYISPGQQVVEQHVILVMGCIELLRRAQWALLRLEWEHHCCDAKARAEAEKEAEAEAFNRQLQVARRQSSGDRIYG